MASTTGINWADATVNFWEGCTKVSEGCKYCYMYRDLDRWKKDGSQVRKVNRSTINKVLRDLQGKPSRIFTCSYSDFFIEDADEWRAEAWEIIKAHPEHQWMILTKRPERILACLPDDWDIDLYGHVWLGISAENQARYDERLPYLLSVPCSIRFISAEPLLGPINLRLTEKCKAKIVGETSLSFVSIQTQNSNFIDWVIVGGESGNDTGKWKYRACKMEWINSIVVQCYETKTALWVKQLGTALGVRFKLGRKGEKHQMHQDLPKY